MALTEEKRLELEAKAHELRHTIVDTVYHAGSGHLGGALSMIDAATLLYYHEMSLKRDDPSGKIGIGLFFPKAMRALALWPSWQIWGTSRRRI